MATITRTLEDLARNAELFAQLKREQGAAGVDEALARAAELLEQSVDSIRNLPDDPDLREREPDALPVIRALRPDGPRRLTEHVDPERYRDRLEGAFLGRSAGCILGSPVEGWSPDRMEAWARETGDEFPPVRYWSSVPDPSTLRYKTIRRDAYTAAKMDGIPVDDDLVYTLLGLLILEDSGPDFTVDDVARAWLRYLPFACTAEDIALANLERGVPASEAAASGGQLPPARACHLSEELPPELDRPLDNPYCQWIGADIRSDPWGYVAPGRPERAAELAYHDACVSHRRNGIYGAMYFSAAISTAFVVDDPVEALRIALTEIPAECSLARALRWAFDVAPEIRTWRDAHAAVTERFPGMHPVHTINNACLTLWGITIGGTDLTRVISETVAMGYDNDCTAATAGSIVGAVVGKGGVDPRWTTPFGDTIHSYLKGIERLSIADVLSRFETQMRRVVSRS
ncbi:MAG: ADP-ribosylglycohydrolase family protein [Spirochaetota bacterium]